MPNGTDLTTNSVTAASSSQDLRSSAGDRSTEQIAEAYWVAVGVMPSRSSLLYHVLARCSNKRLAVTYSEIVTLAEVCCGLVVDELSRGGVSPDHQADNKERQWSPRRITVFGRAEQKYFYHMWSLFKTVGHACQRFSG